MSRSPDFSTRPSPAASCRPGTVPGAKRVRLSPRARTRGAGNVHKQKTLLSKAGHCPDATVLSRPAVTKAHGCSCHPSGCCVISS